MDKFTVTIELGNNAMSHGKHIAKALRELALKVQRLGLTCANGGKIMDINGNTVGQWEVK